MSLWMVLDPVWSPEWLWLRYATFLRASLILMLAGVASILLRSAPPSSRAVLWAVALIALLPLPELRALPLNWSAHVVPSVVAAPMVVIGATMVAQSSPAAVTLPWTSVAGMIWLLGIVLVLGRLLHGWVSVRLLAVRARPVHDAEWQALLREGSIALGIGRRVALTRAQEALVPLTWGTFRPTILLPAEADSWPESYRRAVLLHELAHVRRLDALLALLGHVACAVWWFHPGAWWAAHRLEMEREKACDERVLLAGIKASDYAECLLRVADSAQRSGRTGPAAVTAGLLRRSRLGERLHAILDYPLGARTARRRFAPRLVATAGVVVVLVVGAMRLSPRPQVWWLALESDDWRRRAYAAENIARFGDPASVATLRHVLAVETDPSVNKMAAFGKQLRARSAVPYVRFGWPTDRAAPPQNAGH